MPGGGLRVTRVPITGHGASRARGRHSILSHVPAGAEGVV